MFSYTPQSEAELELEEDTVFFHKNESIVVQRRITKNWKDWAFRGELCKNIWEDSMSRNGNITSQSKVIERVQMWNSRSPGAEQRWAPDSRTRAWLPLWAEWRRYLVWFLSLWILICEVCLVLSNELYREMPIFWRCITKMDNCLQDLTDLFAFLKLKLSYNSKLFEFWFFKITNLWNYG